MAMRKAMCSYASYACGVTSNALVWLHACPRDHAVPWGDIKLPLVECSCFSHPPAREEFPLPRDYRRVRPMTKERQPLRALRKNV